MNRSKKSINNMIFGVANQILTLLLGLIVPKIFIVSYGSEVNGLQSSIAYIYTYIALLESGIGTATIQALFAPVGRNDRGDVNSILSATNLQYKRVAKIYAVIMGIAAVVYPLTITTPIPYITVFFMVLLSGVSSLISFLFYGKFVLLLQADGRSYVVSIIGLLSYVLKNVIKIVLILMGWHFILVYFASMLVSILTLIAYWVYQKRVYPWIDYHVKPKMEAISQSKNVLVHQISSIVCNSTDVLILTYIVRDLRFVSIYNIYLMIFDAVKSLIMNIFSSVNFILGQTFHTDIQLFRRYYHMYETMDIAVSFTFYSVAYVMITPFLRIYTAQITDISYIDPYLPLLFVATKLLTSCREPASQLIYYAGHFRKTQGRAIFEAALNLVISIIASYYWGIYGVLLGTIVALVYRTIDMYIYTAKHFLDRSTWVSIRQWIIYMSAFAGIVFVNNQLVIPVSGYMDFFMKTFLCGVLIGIYYVAVTSIFNWNTFATVVRMVSRKFFNGRKFQ